jgi:hypothetical protein
MITHARGFNSDVTNLTKANVSQLQLRWQKKIDGSIFASPVITPGISLSCRKVADGAE